MCSTQKLYKTKNIAQQKISEDHEECFDYYTSVITYLEKET